MKKKKIREADVSPASLDSWVAASSPRKSRRMIDQDYTDPKAYRDPDASDKDQQTSAVRAVGGSFGLKKALAVGAAMKNNGYTDTGTDGHLDVPLELEDMEFDVSDTPAERPTSSRKKSPPPIPTKSNKAGASWDQNKRSAYNPGMPPRRNEATPAMPDRRSRSRADSPTRPVPMTGPQVTPQQAAQDIKMRGQQTQQTPQRSSTPPGQFKQAPGGPVGPGQYTPAPTRNQTKTGQFNVAPNTPLQAASAPAPKTQPGEQAWDVYVNGGGVYKVPAPDEQTAKTRAMDYLSGGGDPDSAGKKFSPDDFQVSRSTHGESRSLSAEGLAIFKHLVSKRIQEIVRKKEGGGGYNLYAPNKGKKKNPKPVGEFPTRTAAKRAELARFPPKDPETLKKARKRLDKLAKDPKKQQATARKELSAKTPRRSGKAAGERKSRKESIISRISQELTERLFREDDMPGSPWDERISGLDPSSDKKLHKYHQGMDNASTGALGDSHKALAKALRGMARVNPGDVMRDPDRGKMFMPIMLDVDGDEIGPIHLYVDGGHVKIEISPEARESIGSLEPNRSRDLRGGLMSFQEDHLPKIDRAKKAWDERDSHLDSLHQRLDKMVGGMSPAELHLMKQMLRNRRK